MASTDIIFTCDQSYIVCVGFEKISKNYIGFEKISKDYIEWRNLKNCQK